MNHEEAREKARQGESVKREKWDDCRHVRQAKESDADYINYPIEGILVDACDNRVCDCTIIIYKPTEEDQQATDWIIK